MRVTPVFTVALLTALALFAGCGGGILNKEMDVSGEYSLVLADTDPAALVSVEQDLSGSYDNVTIFTDGSTDTYPVELKRTPGGWYDVTWRWTDDTGAEQSASAVGAAFGDNYFAVAEPVEGNPLYIFNVDSGVMGGRLYYFGDTVGAVTNIAPAGQEAPAGPEVTPLDAGLSLNALGVDGTGAPYIAYYGLSPNGESISLSQIINPDTENESTLYGTAVQVGDYLVMNTAGFLTIFQRAGEDWVGMWVDQEADALASEILTPDDAKLDVMTFFVDNAFSLSKQEDGFFIARWQYEGEEPYEAAALTFGDKYLALSLPDPNEPWLGVFTVGEGAMGGKWITWGSTTVMDVDIVSDGAQPPDPPELQPLPKSGDFSCQGTNTEGDPYEGTYVMQSKGDIVACRQTVTPDYGETEVYEGIGVVVDGYLVLATGPFLTVYAPSGNDWDGMWADPYDKKLCDEKLTYSE
jgi:hypothetical protein